MLNTCITSTISLRARKSSLPFQTNDYSHCTTETHPFFYSSSRSCCCCCCSNPMYTLPVIPNYCFDPYGSRQSSLIQCSLYRRLVRSDFNRFNYTRLPVSGFSGTCNCDRIPDFRAENVGRRKGGFRRCMMFGEMPERYNDDIGGLDEAEAVLSLLTEDIDEECYIRVEKETRRFLKNKPVVENRENRRVVSKKKRIDLGVVGNENYPTGILRKKDDRSREGIIWREEENRKERKDSLKNRMVREKEEAEEALLRKSSQRVDEKRERETILRKVEEKRERESILRNERDNLSRREEQRQKVRRDGSSCSSYYSFSSTGDDDESENETELRDSLSDGNMKNTSFEIVDQNAQEEDQKILTKIGTSVVESEFRKKSEKKLDDVSVEEESSKKFLLKKESDFFTARESNYEKVKSSESIKLDENSSRQSETRLKYKQFVGTQDTRIDNVRNSYESKKLFSGNREKAGETGAAVGVSKNVNKYENNSCKVSEISESQEIDISRKSSNQQRFEKDYSTNVLIQDDRVSGQVESRGTSQNLTDKSILKKELDKIIKEDKSNLSYGSSLESKQTRSQRQAKIIERVNSRTESDGIITHSGSSVAISVDNRIKTKSEKGVLPVEPTVGSDTYDGSLQHEDAISSAARLDKSSEHYVGEFVSQLRGEISSSEIQTEKKTYETIIVPEEQKNLLQSSSGGSKGPTDEMWKMDEQKLPEPETQDNKASKPENAVAKRTRKSLWNIFADIVRVRWAPRSESRSSGRKTSTRNSPDQSTSSETWFSGHEAEENEGTSITRGLSSGRQEIKTLSLFEKGSSSSTSGDYKRNVGINTPSSSVVLEAFGGNSGDTSSAVSVPPLRLRRFSAMRLESGNESQPESGMSMEKSELAINEEEIKRKKLKRTDHVEKDRFDKWEEAYMVEAEQRKMDEMFMKEALLEAKKAADNWEVPVGAVLVHNGKIIARGCNLVEEMRDSTAHAEIMCIREASNVLKTWRLSETTLYITLEPCPMCAGAILQARVDAVVWGAPNKLLGADGSWIRLFPSGGGENNGLEQSDKPAAPVHPFHPKIVVRRGVLASECADAMQQFFKLRRKKDKKPKPPPSPPPPSCLPISHHPSKFLARMHDTISLMFCL